MFPLELRPSPGGQPCSPCPLSQPSCMVTAAAPGTSLWQIKNKNKNQSVLGNGYEPDQALPMPSKVTEPGREDKTGVPRVSPVLAFSAPVICGQQTVLVRAGELAQKFQRSPGDSKRTSECQNQCPLGEQPGTQESDPEIVTKAAKPHPQESSQFQAKRLCLAFRP